METSGNNLPKHALLSESEGLSNLLTELEWQTEHFPTSDTIAMAFCLAVKEMITEDTNFANTIGSFIHDRPDITPSHRVNILRHGVQKQLLRKTLDPSRPYPHAYTDPENWKSTLKIIATPDSPEHEEFHYDVCYRTVQSNIAERYKAFALIGGLAASRFNEAPRILDIGCSQNQGLKKLALAHLGSRFDDVEIMQETDDPEDKPELIVDDVLSIKANDLLRSSLPIGKSLGVDVMHVNDQGNKEWAKACSFYPQELLDPHRVEEYDLLEIANPPDVGFLCADFSDTEMLDLTEQYDLVIFSTVLYQVDELSRARMIRNALKSVRPSGLIVVQDFAGVDAFKPRQLNFHSSWFSHSYNYKTLILDPQEPARFHEVFRWENSRCQRMLPGLDISFLDTAA